MPTKTAAAMKSAKPSKVAEYLTRHIDGSDKSQYQIAQEAGFDRPNIISMFKVGLTKLPIARIAAMAAAIDADANELFRLCMEEYLPEVLVLADEVYAREKLTDGEREVIKRLRIHTSGRNFRATRPVLEAVDDLASVIK